MGDDSLLDGIVLERHKTWNEHANAALGVIAATVVVAFMVAMLLIVVRWFAHITHVWPM